MAVPFSALSPKSLQIKWQRQVHNHREASYSDLICSRDTKSKGRHLCVTGHLQHLQRAQASKMPGCSSVRLINDRSLDNNNQQKWSTIEGWIQCLVSSHRPSPFNRGTVASIIYACITITMKLALYCTSNKKQYRLETLATYKVVNKRDGKWMTTMLSSLLPPQGNQNCFSLIQPTMKFDTDPIWRTGW